MKTKRLGLRVNSKGGGGGRKGRGPMQIPTKEIQKDVLYFLLEGGMGLSTRSANPPCFSFLHFIVPFTNRKENK